MVRSAFRVSMAACALLAAMPASAAQFVFSATLSGAQENPVVVTPGTGFAIITIDDVSNTMRVQTTFSGLLGNTTASHIHCCAAFGANAGVATQTPTFAGFPLGVTSGTYDNTFDMTLAGSYNAAFLNNAVNLGNVATARATLFNGIAAGRAYLNVHTSQFPGGEIRGQLTPGVPEPASWAMVITGFGFAGVALRRRRQTALAA
jgi:CHRD domain/PEP-CTERM motif